MPADYNCGHTVAMVCRAITTTFDNNITMESELDIDIARTCWFLTGATASGKSSVSLQLADRLDAEILSLDSMAVYRGMDIGTAKPTQAEREQWPHHLIDLRDPNETFSTSQYREAALERIAEILSRGKSVLFVGGTALYLKACLLYTSPSPRD